MNKKFIILASFVTVFFIFVMALVFALTFNRDKNTQTQTQIETKTVAVSNEKEVYVLKPSVTVRDYNQNTKRSFPAPYNKVNGLPLF